LIEDKEEEVVVVVVVFHHPQCASKLRFTSIVENDVIVIDRGNECCCFQRNHGRQYSQSGSGITNEQ
jgi:hypothetical protein